MLPKFFELAAFVISAGGFGWGAVHLLKKGTPMYFRFYVYAAGCYVLEELWVIVNAYFGRGVLEGLLTVRLFGIFGCFSFILSANANVFDRIVDEGRRKAVLPAFAAPVLLTAIYVLYLALTWSKIGPLKAALGFLSVAPALPASYYSLKHLLIPPDSLNLISSIRPLNILSLLFFTAVYSFLLIYLFDIRLMTGIYDAFTAVLLAGIMICSERGASKWKMLI